MTNLTLLEQEILSDIENRRDLMSRSSLWGLSLYRKDKNRLIQGYR